jgi:RNA polymerase sigma factor (sigma-70 family)
MNASDREYLERFVAQQDQAAFEQLVSKYGPMVLATCERILGDAHEAHDVFQAVFLVLAKKASSIRNLDSLGTWLYRVASNTSLKVKARVSHRIRECVPLEEDMHPHTNTNDEQQWAEIRPMIDEELSKLPEKYRSPLILCYLEGMTYEEAAEELGLTHKAVKMRLERTRDLLRDRFAQRGLVLSSAAIGTLLTQHASAAIPQELVRATIETGALKAATSTKVLALAKSALNNMFFHQLKWGAVAALILVGGVIGILNSTASGVKKTQSDLWVRYEWQPYRVGERDLVQASSQFPNPRGELGILYDVDPKLQQALHELIGEGRAILGFATTVTLDAGMPAQCDSARIKTLFKTTDSRPLHIEISPLKESPFSTSVTTSIRNGDAILLYGLPLVAVDDRFPKESKLNERASTDPMDVVLLKVWTIDPQLLTKCREFLHGALSRDSVVAVGSFIDSLKLSKNTARFLLLFLFLFQSSGNGWDVFDDHFMNLIRDIQKVGRVVMLQISNRMRTT